MSKTASNLLRAAVIVVLLAAAGYAVLSGGDKPEFLKNPMAPEGSTPEQVRAFCTDIADQAGNWQQNAQDPVGSRMEASNEAFAACMARHDVDK